MAATYTDTADLELLVEVADTGSLTKAAKALRIHHATAFRRLCDLEKRAGAPMFERLPHGYVPTSAAHKLLARLFARPPLIAALGSRRVHAVKWSSVRGE